MPMTASRQSPRPRPQLGAGDRERRLQGRAGEVGQLGGDVADAAAAGEVARGEPEQRRAVGDAQRVERGAVRPVGDRRSAVGSAPTASAARRAARCGRPASARRRSRRQCSGWRARWSASAGLAPSTASSRARRPLVGAQRRGQVRSASAAPTRAAGRAPAAPRPGRRRRPSAASSARRRRRRPAAVSDVASARRAGRLGEA